MRGIHKSQIVHIQQESREEIRQNIRKHRVECVEVGDQVYYKKGEGGGQVK